MIKWLSLSPSTCAKPLSPMFAAADKDVQKCLSSGKKRKRTYNKFNDEQRAELANHACMHGTTETARVFSLKWDVDIPESTVRNLRGKMVKRLKFENGKKRKNKMQQKSENEKIENFMTHLFPDLQYDERTS